MKTAGKQNVVALTLAGLLIATGGIATAKSKVKAKPAPAAKKASKTAEAKKAKAAPAAARRAPKPGSLEAMLAQARSASKAPVVQRKAAKQVRLRVHTRAAGKLDLSRKNRSTKTPGGELMLRMKAATLDSKEVTSVIKKKMKSLMYCHEMLVAKGAGAPKGSVSLRFVVEPLGSVSKVTVQAAGKNHKTMERCMERSIAKWKFSTADAPTTVAYPFLIN